MIIYDTICTSNVRDIFNLILRQCGDAVRWSFLLQEAVMVMEHSNRSTATLLALYTTQTVISVKWGNRKGRKDGHKRQKHVGLSVVNTGEHSAIHPGPSVFSHALAYSRLPSQNFLQYSICDMWTHSLGKPGISTLVHIQYETQTLREALHSLCFLYRYLEVYFLLSWCGIHLAAIRHIPMIKGRICIFF